MENVPPPPAEPAGDTAPPPPPPGGDMGGDMTPPPPGDDMGGDTAPPPPGDDMGDTAPSDDMGDEHEEGGITFKTIQKLTGKLGQKLRSLESQGDEPMSSKDIKYVINSILSAVNLDSLEDEDKEEIMNKFDGEEDMGDEDFGSEDDMDSDEDMGDTAPASIDTGDEEQPAGEMGETWDALGSEIAGKSLAKAMTPGQFSEGGEMEEDHIGRIADELFVENKVENILSKYFTITESEKKFNKTVDINRKNGNKINEKSIAREIKRLSENVIQEVSSRKFLSENKNAKLIGKTNKRNLVFEIGTKQFKVLTNGNII